MSIVSSFFDNCQLLKKLIKRQLDCLNTSTDIIIDNILNNKAIHLSEPQADSIEQ